MERIASSSCLCLWKSVINSARNFRTHTKSVYDKRAHDWRNLDVEIRIEILLYFVLRCFWNSVVKLKVQIFEFSDRDQFAKVILDVSLTNSLKFRTNLSLWFSLTFVRRRLKQIWLKKTKQRLGRAVKRRKLWVSLHFSLNISTHFIFSLLRTNNDTVHFIKHKER